MHLKIYVILLTTLLIGCDGTDSENLPTTEFSNDYKLSDFKLNENYSYWEIRRGDISEDQSYGDDIIKKFDVDTYEGLSASNLALLNNADTNYGFDSQCAPSYCPIYGVALLDDAVTLIESKSDLITFFDEIDTEAELSILLSIGYQKAKYYEANKNGYRVIVQWDSLCGTRGDNLIQVFKDGSIELIKELSTEDYQGCV